MKTAIGDIHDHCETTVEGVHEIANMSGSLVEISNKLTRVSGSFNLG